MSERAMVCANGALTVRMDPGAPDGYEIARIDVVVRLRRRDGRR